MTLGEVAAACPYDLGQSSPLLITQQMVDAHAETTGDAQWIHNDPERAIRESPFGAPIVQGFLLLAVLTQLSSGLPRNGGPMAVSCSARLARCSAVIGAVE